MSRFQEIWSEQQNVVERDEHESVDNYSSMVIYIMGKSYVSFACGAPMPCRAGSSNVDIVRNRQDTPFRICRVLYAKSLKRSWGSCSVLEKGASISGVGEQRFSFPVVLPPDSVQ